MLLCDSAKANLVFLHGWGDHAGRYYGVGETLNAAGYNILIPDFPGHGLSEGPVARVDDFAVLESDLDHFLNSQALLGPVVLCAHSMGGALAFHYSIKNNARIDSVIFNSAALMVNTRIPWWKRLGARLLGSWLPHLKVAKLKAAAMMTSLPSEIRDYDDDKLLYHGKAEAATGKALLNANHWVMKNLDNFSIPFLVLQGDDDVLVNPHGPQLLMNRSPINDKQLKLYKGSRHDLLHDFAANQVIADIGIWLEARFT